MKIRLIAMLFVLLPALAVADETRRFTKEEVRKNVIDFIDTVFSTKPPTLADLIRFSGSESMLDMEVPFEEEICRKKYKATPPADWGDCWGKFVSPRHDHPNKFESLYYKALRAKLSVTAEMMKIESVKYEPENGVGYYLIIVSIKNSSGHPFDPIYGNRQLILRHVGSFGDVPESGTVAVKAVVLPISDYVSLPKPNNEMGTEPN